jgi:hypothetical protein
MVSRVTGLLLLLVATEALAQQRPVLRGVSSVRIANYGAPSVLLQKRDEVRDVVEEMNSLRRKEWRRGDTALNCYSTLLFMSGQKRVGEFRLRPDMVVERPVDKGQSAYTALIEPADIPRIAKRLSEAKPATCK